MLALIRCRECDSKLLQLERIRMLGDGRASPTPLPGVGTRDTVHLEAAHLCTRMRGVEEHSRTTTTFWRGGVPRPGPATGVPPVGRRPQGTELRS